MPSKPFLIDIDARGSIFIGSIPNNVGNFLTVSSLDGKTISRRTNQEVISDLNLLTTAHAANVITPTDISNWNTSFGWGNHAGLYALSSHTHPYDNYVSWNLKTNGVQRIGVVKDGILDIVAGSNTSVSYSAGGVVTIAASDNNTWNANTQAIAGYVAAGGTNYNKVWGTDGTGNPSWMTPVGGGTYTSSLGIEMLGNDFRPTYGTTASTIAQGNDSRILNGQTAFVWGNHAGLYPTYAGVGATGTWGINISGNASTASNSTKWNGYDIAPVVLTTGAITQLPFWNGNNNRFEFAEVQNIKTWLGLGSNAYTSTAYLPLAGNSTVNGTITATSFSGDLRANIGRVKELIITDASGVDKYKLIYNAATDSLETIKI